MIMKRIIILALMLFLISGCSEFNNLFKIKKEGPIVVPKMMTKCYKLDPFKVILAKGEAKVELINGPYAITVTGRFEGYPKQVRVEDKILHLDGNGENGYGDLVMKVSAPNLKRIVAKDNATISSKKLRLEDVTLVAKGRGAINLLGSFDVRKIVQRGQGRINISWICGDDLFIDSSNSGPISLAGRVESMNVKLTNNARFYGRYLRANKATVFTTDKARADVLPLDDLGAYAIDFSSIYYYKRPENITVVTRDSGNVLSPEQIK